MSEPANPVDAFLNAVRTATIPACDAWADDVRLDATVPGWRFHLTGAASVRAQFASWFADVAEFESLRRIPFAGGEVVDYTLVWEEDGVPHAAHHTHILDVQDGHIVTDVALCGGRWPAPLLAEMAEADA